MKRVLGRLRDRDRDVKEVREELEFHIARQTEANLAAGMTPEEARAAALRTFGGAGRIEEECHEARGSALIESVVDDARLGLRLITRNPAFAFAVIATLAVAIAACATMYSVVDAVLLKPIGFPDPARLLALYEVAVNDPEQTSVFSPPNFLDLQQQTRTLAATSAYHSTTWNLVGRDTESVDGIAATAQFFEVLGVPPMSGRTFRNGDIDVGVVSYALATRQFGSAAAAVNRPLLLDGKRMTVIGVMPPAFRFRREEVQIWTPLIFDFKPGTQRGAHFLRVIGRVRASATPESAMREVDTIGRRLSAAYPDTNEGATFRGERLDKLIVRDVRRGLLILLGSVIVLALIASANVANLLLARAAARVREWSMRSALGASRLRVMRQFLTESLVFAFFAGIVGVALTWICVRLVIALAPDNIPRLREATISPRVLLLTLGAVVFMSLLFGILPALSAAGSAKLTALRGGGRVVGGRSASRLRAIMAVAQLALAVTLLAGAGLLVRSFLNVTDVPPGYDPRNITTFDLSLPSSRYDGTGRVNTFHDALLQRLRNTPGVQAAGAASSIPIEGSPFFSDFKINGVENKEWQASVYVADEGYFRTLRIPLLRGRLFDGTEKAGGHRVVLANESAVKKFWPGRDPLGMQLRFGANAGYEDYEGEIVGVVADLHQHGRETDVVPTFYVPLRQAGLDFATYVVKSQVDPAALIASIREEVAAVDRTVALSHIATMEDHLEDSTARRRFQLFLLSFFAAAAMLLASLGIYGVIAYSVTQRTREIGVRVALGSSIGGVFRMILSEALWLVIPAIVAGLGAALAMHRLIAALLFRVSPTDGATFAAVGVVVAAVSLLAACIPARRAASIDPIAALRYE